jgi:Notch-like protein
VFKHPFPNVYMSPVTKKVVKDIMKSLKWKYLHGYDEIPQYILKISLPFILAPPTYMCNKVLSLGVFPSRLKCSKINPIFKKGDRTDIANYRPLSILTSFAKIFERIIYINKNVNVRLFKILNLRKFFTDCFEILTQCCIRIRAFLCTYIT